MRKRRIIVSGKKECSLYHPGSWKKEMMHTNSFEKNVIMALTKIRRNSREIVWAMGLVWMMQYWLFYD